MTAISISLGELIKTASVPRAGAGEYPILSMTMHEGLVDQASKFKKRVASENTSAYKVVKRGQLVVGFPIDEGVLSFQTLYDEAIVSPAYDVWDVRDGSLVAYNYLEKFLKCPRSLAFYRSKLRSTTARRRTIPKETFLGLEVPLPSLDEQERIASILDQADELGRKRQRAIDSLNQLEQAIFHEMFGDPKTNSKGLTIVSLGEIADFYSGNSLPEGEPYSGQKDGYLLLKVSDLNHTENQEVVSCAANWSSKPGTRAGTCPANALVFPKRGGAISTNKKRWLKRSAILDPNLMGVRPHEERLTMSFLKGWFQTFNLSDIASGSSVPQLNKKDLAPLKVALPPIDDQQRYASRIDQLSRSRQKMVLAAERNGHLLSALQQKAFEGGL